MNDFFKGRVMLRAREVEELLGVADGTTISWIQNGIDIPYYQVGGSNARMFDQREVLDWWASKRKINGQEEAPPPPYDPPTSWERARKQKFDEQTAKFGNAKKY
jgi:predicted DNA-binding transcriptional regulator AlpA